MSAAHQIGTGRASAFPLHLIAQAIGKLSRHDLEALTERLIDRLDEVDGDTDKEEDDPSGLCDEDEINTSLWLKSDGQAGCPISGLDADESDYEIGIVNAETFHAT